jgi:hypothetical protein
MNRILAKDGDEFQPKRIENYNNYYIFKTLIEQAFAKLHAARKYTYSDDLTNAIDSALDNINFEFKD